MQKRCNMASTSFGYFCNCDQSSMSLFCNWFSGKCKRNKADVLFIIDSSSSLTPLSVHMLRQMAIDMTYGLDVDNKVRIAAACFSNNVNQMFKFDHKVETNRTETLSRFEDALWNAPHMAGSTNLGDALLAVKRIFAEEGRAGAHHLVVFVMDEKSNFEPSKVPVVAADVRAAGIEVLAVGAGLTTSAMMEAMSIVSSPRSSNLFIVEKDSKLSEASQSVINRLCTSK